MTRRRLSWLFPLVGALAATLLFASPGLAATSGTWTPTTPMEIGRAFFTANLLRDGRVLVAGGFNGGSGNVFFKSAEIYDPATARWTPAANMHEARAAAVSVRLPGGRVMVIGGENLTSSALASVEIYDPRTNTWTETAPMLQGRNEDFVAVPSVGTSHTHVLVAGGYDENGNPLAEVETYNVSTNSWSSATPMNVARGEFRWVRLNDGRIFAAGGCCDQNGSLSSAEIYDPVAKTWTMTASMSTGRFDLSLVKLQNGNVLAAGGGIIDPDTGEATYLASSETWNPDTGGWTAKGDMTTPRSEVDQAASLLPDGKVLVPGGFKAVDTPQSDSDVYDPSTGTWSAAGEMSSIRAGHQGVNLSDGSILVVGGLAEEPVSTPTADIFTE